MKINWFSPLLPAMTDIAHYTSRILPTLAERMEVTLWTPKKEWDPSLERFATVRSFQPDALPYTELQRADLAFYNIGNNAEFHLEIWQASRRHPGVIILHDIRLQQFFADCYRWLWGDLPGFREVMGNYYGEAGRRDAERFWADEVTTEYMVNRYPLTPFALEGALGAVVHTAAAYADLSREGWCPVAWSPLPYMSLAPSARRPKRRARSQDSPQPVRLIMFGYIHENRRVESILKALALLPQRDRFRLDIYGQIWNPELVESLIDRHKLRGYVAIKGFVPEVELEAALDEADLALNLRFPSVGEASGSQLRIWDHALPSVVTRVGWYATIPQDAVAFVNPENEIADIQSHLLGYLRDPEPYRRMGLRGREILEQKHSPKAYAAFIEKVAAAAPRLRSRAAGVVAGFRAAEQAARWVTCGTAGDLVNRVVRQIDAAWDLTTPLPAPFRRSEDATAH